MTAMDTHLLCDRDVTKKNSLSVVASSVSLSHLQVFISCIGATVIFDLYYSNPCIWWVQIFCHHHSIAPRHILRTAKNYSGKGNQKCMLTGEEQEDTPAI